MKYLFHNLLPLFLFFSISVSSASPIERVRLYGDSGQLVLEKVLLGYYERVYLTLGGASEGNDLTDQQQAAMALLCQLRYEVIPYKYGDIWLVPRGRFDDDSAINCKNIPSVLITRLKQKIPVSDSLDYLRFFTPEFIHWLTHELSHFFISGSIMNEALNYQAPHSLVLDKEIRVNRANGSGMLLSKRMEKNDFLYALSNPKQSSVGFNHYAVGLYKARFSWRKLDDKLDPNSSTYLILRMVEYLDLLRKLHVPKSEYAWLVLQVKILLDTMLTEKERNPSAHSFEERQEEDKRIRSDSDFFTDLTDFEDGI